MVGLAFPVAAQVFERSRSVSTYAIAVLKSITIEPTGLNSVGILAEQPIEVPETSLLRIHFEVRRGMDQAGWRVEVVDATGKIVSADYGASKREFWSGEVRGGSALVRLVTDRSNVNPQIHIDKVLVSKPISYPQAITTDRSDIRSIDTEGPYVRALGRSVARLRLVGGDGIGYFCTGFVIAPETLVTNEHCVDGSEVAKSGIVDFDFDSPGADSFESRITELLLANFELDYAVVRIDRLPTGVSPLRLAPKVLTVGYPLLILQHPGGQFKQVSRINCLAKTSESVGRGLATDFAHVCNTLGGSSGSPILDRDSGKVLGVHHLGFADGSPNAFNQGVKLDLIVDDIMARDPSLYQQLNVDGGRETVGANAPSASIVRILTSRGFSSTGFIADANGLVVTIGAAIDRDQAVSVLTNDGKKYRGEVLKVSKSNSLGIIRVPELEGPVVRFAEREPLRDERVSVVGFAGDLGELSGDDGIVLSIADGMLNYTRARRSIPGLAGGPVFLSSGEVIGMHWGIAPSKADSAAMAVSVRVIQEELADIKAKFPLERPSTATATRKWRSYFQLTCGETVNGPIRATTLLGKGETIAGAVGSFENIENVRVIKPIRVTVDMNGGAVAEFEMQGPDKALFAPCGAPGRATLVVTFEVQSTSFARGRPDR
jgi:V8-like Glu-specific endopeptidase